METLPLTSLEAVKVLEFLKCVAQIKKEKRTGWTHHDIKHVESVSDHMYMMALMSFLIEDKDVNKNHCIKMAVVHDLAECIVGDITPFCGISKEEKHQQEKDAMLHITQMLPYKDVADEMMELWTEYGEQKTKEAKIVKDIDRFEMIFQAFQYERDENRVGDLEIFFNSTKDKFQTEEMKTLDKELRFQRESLKK